MTPGEQHITATATTQALMSPQVQTMKECIAACCSPQDAARLHSMLNSLYGIAFCDGATWVCKEFKEGRIG